MNISSEKFWIIHYILCFVLISFLSPLLLTSNYFPDSIFHFRMHDWTAKVDIGRHLFPSSCSRMVLESWKRENKATVFFLVMLCFCRPIYHIAQMKSETKMPDFSSLLHSHIQISLIFTLKFILSIEDFII